MAKSKYKKLKSKKSLSTITKALPGERSEIASPLMEKKWFNKTSFNLQKKLLTLPEDFNGFLIDLASRPENIGQVKVLKLVDLNVSNYLAIPVFEVQSQLTNEKFTYEYTSWKYGKHTGYRGIIFVEIEGKVKYFITRRAEKFAIADKIYDAFGGLDLKFSSNKLINLQFQVEKRLKKLLGLKELNFKRFIDLGVISPDAGLTNEKVGLFAAMISFEDAKLIESRFNSKKHRSTASTYELEIHPIERMLGMVAKSDDSFFLASVARLAALNIINL